jgi:hypothetical protein
MLSILDQSWRISQVLAGESSLLFGGFTSADRLNCAATSPDIQGLRRESIMTAIAMIIPQPAATDARRMLEDT